MCLTCYGIQGGSEQQACAAACIWTHLDGGVWPRADPPAHLERARSKKARGDERILLQRVLGANAEANARRRRISADSVNMRLVFMCIERPARARTTLQRLLDGEFGYEGQTGRFLHRAALDRNRSRCSCSRNILSPLKNPPTVPDET